uniref:SUMO specific peptidase 5 n=1 Tax=Sinocyclocheilus grahami TaxID=75366 RepID=A0A672P069_SINGR
MITGKLKRSFNFTKPEVAKYRAGLACAPMHFFQVTYNKHSLTLDDLSTLDDQNWVNDQVDIVFFFVAKGYEGVRRWTKKVDLFSKTLILIPLHLEIHWSLIILDVSKQSINIFDSQGILFKFAVDNILKYILAEAKEKKQAVFQKGWKMVINRTIPQQKNDNDCGVFVLEYCKCLAFMKPLLFTQEDMPRVRKRIYRELCDCRLSGCLNQDKAS